MAEGIWTIADGKTKSESFSCVDTLHNTNTTEIQVHVKRSKLITKVIDAKKKPSVILIKLKLIAFNNA